MSILEKFIATFADSSQCLNDKIKNAPEVMNITTLVNDCVLDILNGKCGFFFCDYLKRFSNFIVYLNQNQFLVCRSMAATKQIWKILHLDSEQATK
jgi:hypothetical protein